MRWPKNKTTPIGVDVGSRFIKAAQLSPAGALAATCIVPRTQMDAPLSSSDVQQLQGALYRNGFVGAQIVLAMPNDKVLCESLELPPRTSDAPLDQIARLELARIRKTNPDAMEMDFWDVATPARAAKATHVMAVGCLHADADVLLECFERQGLAVLALDVPSQALSRACKPLLGTSGEITGILDIGFNSAVLIVLHMGQVCYQRIVAEAGVRHLHRELHEQLSLENDVADFLLGESDAGDARPIIAAHFEAMIAELRTSFAYVSQQYPDASTGKIFICGGGACVAGLSEVIEQRLHVPAKVLKPSDVIACASAAMDEHGSGLLTAIGLAQHETA